ncbi:MAG: hypothetical protein J7521_23460 [Caulobacter sp.]|nr:hypothetical protein [Caulobacter sp.]
MSKSDTVIAVLGDEYDDEPIKRTIALLDDLGGRLVECQECLVGSQLVQVQVWDFDGQSLRLEGETYVGLSVEGPDTIIDALTRRLAAAGFSRS